MSSQSSGEGDIRKRIIEADLVDAIVALPGQLFFNTGIRACLWFMTRDKAHTGRARKHETLFIDASELGYMMDRTHRGFAEADIEKIRDTYYQWKHKDGTYEDEKGFCKSASIEDIQKHNYVLTPGRYVGIPDEIDDGIPFADKMRALTDTLVVQMKQEKVLDEAIKAQLKNIGYEL
jgi:type I restriction enzyme M protein